MTEANELPQNQSTDPDTLELKLPDESAQWRDIGLWAGVLALLTFIAYWPATTGSFIWRDERLSESKALLAPGALSHIWLDRWQNPSTFKQPLYQPVAMTAYWLEYRAGGHNDAGVPAPTAYHVASLFFHTLAAILLWLGLRELVLPGAWLMAGIFALHPLHAEGVSWISEQPIVLAGMFFFGSIYLYLLFVKSLHADAAERLNGRVGIDPAQTWGFYAGSAACGLLALLSHPSTIVLPVILLLLLWWRNHMKSRDVLLQLPILLVGAVLWFKDVDLNTGNQSVIVHARAIGQVVGFTLFKLLVPFALSIIYVDMPNLLGLIFFILAVVAVVALYKINRSFFVGVAALLITVCFSVNWFDYSRLSWKTDSTAYLAIVPLIVMIVGLIRRLKIPGPHPQSLVAICGVVLLALGSLAWVRTHAFESSIALWRDTLRKNPASTFAESSLAEQLRLQAIDDTAQGNTDAVKPELDESIQHARAVVQRDPFNDVAQRTWGDALVAQDKIPQALSHFESASRLAPANAGIRTDYASALNKLGQFKAAIPQLNEALKYDVNSSVIHRLLGEAYNGTGNPDRAIKEQQLALGIDPADFVARQDLAELQIKTGALKQAIESYAMILGDATQQKRPEIWVAVAKIKDQQGAYDLAVQYLQTAQQLAPEDEAITKLLETEQTKQKKAAATQPATTRSTR